MEKRKKDDAIARRVALKELSNKLKSANVGENVSVNDLLKDYYAGQGHTVLKTYNEWKENGFFVKKGERALLLWARPKASKMSKENAVALGKKEEDAKEDFFPVAYMFSEKQVNKA